jgi:hypothetical protein
MSKSDRSVVLDPEWQRKLDALPDVVAGRQGHQWTEQEDEVLRRYWKTKRQSDVCAMLGLSSNPCRRRARELGVAS